MGLAAGRRCGRAAWALAADADKAEGQPAGRAERQDALDGHDWRRRRRKEKFPFAFTLELRGGRPGELEGGQSS